MLDTNVAISTRIRLARNLADYFFPTIIYGTPDEVSIVNTISGILSRAGGFNVYYVGSLGETEKLSLIERYVISKNLAASRQGAVGVSKDGLLSVMINEEDHIREQCMVKGLDLKNCYARISGFDKMLGQNCRFAKKGNFYYTACPTNLGTGMRASVMMFLPALTRSEKISEIVEKAHLSGLTVRGAFGEGSVAEGYYYQVSNSVTMDVTPSGIVSAVENFAYYICDAELDERYNIFSADKTGFRDRCLRALGTLKYCVTLSYAEFVELVSEVKLGVSLDIISCKNPYAIDDLTVSARPYTLGLNSRNLPGETENAKRASFVKRALTEIRCEEA